MLFENFAFWRSIFILCVFMNDEVLRVTKAGRKLNKLNERGTY